MYAGSPNPLFFVAAVLLTVAAHVLAQGVSSMTGVVRDTSGAVPPGVTVEAASMALIEKVCSTVTDIEGLYRIVDLRPGEYAVTFTLPGFSTFRRDGIVLPANFTATVNGDMAVGAVEETITVTGKASLVDVQRTQRETGDALAGAEEIGADVFATAEQIADGFLELGGNVNRRQGSWGVPGNLATQQPSTRRGVDTRRAVALTLRWPAV